MTLNIEGIKARAMRAADMGTLDAHIASAEDVSALIAEVERLRELAKDRLKIAIEADNDSIEAQDKALTLNARITAIEAERDALKEALKMPDADRRQWFLSELVSSKGYFNRANLCEAFGISTPQASTDIRRFLTKFPGLIEYDKTAKRYARRALEAKP